MGYPGRHRVRRTQHDTPGWPCKDYDVVSVTTQWLIGRIFTEPMAHGEQWRWSITSVFWEGSSGYSDMLEHAKREFAATWRAWRAKTGRDEEMYRPRYGRPVDSMGTGRSDLRSMA